MKNRLFLICALLSPILAHLQSVTFAPNNSILCYQDTCVGFSNMTLNVASNLWNFGDPASLSNNTSTALNPTHCFVGGPGMYTITLTVVFTNSTTGVGTGNIIITADSASFTSVPNGVNTIDFTDISGGNPVMWNWDFGDAGTSTQQNPTHVYAGSGTYNVRLVTLTTYGCLDTTFTNVVVSPNGILETNSDNNVYVYPNPSGDHHFVLSTSTELQIGFLVTDILGNVLLSGNLLKNSTLDLSFLASGVYFLKTDDGNSIKLIAQ